MTEEQDKSGGAGKSDKLYTFDEALDMAGNGYYNIMLLTVMCLGVFAMGCDMFGFSVVVTGATCDFSLGIEQTSVLLSMPFVGPIVMSYPWGYTCDTLGRRRSILVSLWGCCLVSSISAFSPNWIVLAFLKFVSTSFISCVQSATFTLIGESCPQRVRDCYMLVMTSTFECVLPLYIGIAYCILNKDFSYNMGLISFMPWRALVLVLACIPGIAAVGSHFLYESPKFLLNEGRDKEVLNILSKIYEKNGGAPGSYPVKKVYLNEEGNTSSKDDTMPLWKSLWQQVVPLFRPPLLWRSMQVYFLMFVTFGASNSYFIWFPYLAQKFVDGMSSPGEQVSGLCKLIVSNASNTDQAECNTKVEVHLFWSTLVMGVTFTTLLCSIASVAHRKRTISVILLMFSSACSIAAVVIPHNIISLLLFFGTLTNGLVIGMIYSYIVDLYPTSFRGMATCLGTMVARSGALSGVNMLGAFLISHCVATFSVCSVLMFAAVLVMLMLPRDKPRK